jgi:hypothetical protein
MIRQSIVAVVLPAGLASGANLRANVYLTPRLSGAHLLSAFPDWLDWTSLVQRHGLRFTFSCGGRTATLAADTSALRPDIWQAVFGHDSIVDEYPAPDFDRRLLVSYPSRDAHDFLRYAYQFATTTSGRDRDGGTLQTLLADFVFRDEHGNSTLDDTLSHLRVQLWNEQQGGAADSGNTGTTTPELAAGAALPITQPPLTRPAGTRPMIERLALYHHLPPAPGRPPLPSTPGELARLIDFHQALTALTGYPSLLPALGLAFAVELPGTLCPASPEGGSYLSVQVSALDAGWTWTHPPTLGAPATAYVRGPDAFSAAPATAPADLASGIIQPADVLDGFLALTASDFHLVGVDLDGALLKAMALADSLANASDPQLDDGLLPALRSSGISLLADDRAQQLLRAIRDNKGFDAVLTGATVRALNARDLTRGYRIDIYSDRSGQWQSLHRRDGTYRFGDGSLVVHTTDEEGFTQLAVTQPADDPSRKTDPVATAAGAPQPGTDLYVNERIARWNGWGLSAPRPGTPLNRSPHPALATDPDPTAGQSVTTFNAATSFVPHPGALPLLRFGSRYRVRARAVDLAGDSRPLSAPAADQVVSPADGQLLPYYRYEPVGPPVVVLRTLPGLGGSLLELVIRSYNSNPSLDTVATDEVDERHVAPPRAAVQMVEHHGMLDDAAGRLRGDPATYELITARDRGEIPVVGQDPIETGPQLVVPYFPDPPARGAALTDLPQTLTATDGVITSGALSYIPVAGVNPRPGSVTKVSFGRAWPEREAFRIRLAEGDVPPTWSDGERVLTVVLPKGQVATTALSCFTTPDDLDLLGVWNWMRELLEALDAYALQQADAAPELVAIAEIGGQLTRQVLDGGNEFITPSAQLQLTHAVQQPLGRPSWTRLPIVHNPASPIVAAALANSFCPVTAWRSLGSHHTVLLGALQISGATTAAIDLEARWIDWVDDVTQPAPTRVRASAHVERIPLPSLAGGPVAADGTGVRQVAVYIPKIDALWFAAPFDQLDGVESPFDVAAPMHQLGDTLHRTIRYRAVASSRFQEYFPEPGTVTSRTGLGLTVDVPSSARPLPPDIVCVLPTFGWERQVSTDTKTEVRVGNALRVYLRRPWYSSGSAEELGVVLWSAGQAAPSDDQREASKALITQWGLDPIWASGPISDIPSLDTFPNAAHRGSGLTLQESTKVVDVAGHPVGYDADRQLWYCDIVFDNPSAYTPFVRLALARYQPRSIAGVELSHVVLSDFAQLSPDRSATLTVDPADPRTARLVVAGLAPTGPTQPYFTVTVEARHPDINTDLGWEPSSPAQALVTEDSPAPSQPASVLYSGTIRFAHRPAPGSFRVVVREFEVIEADPPPTALSDTPEYGARLVYVSILPFDYPLAVEAT